MRDVSCVAAVQHAVETGFKCAGNRVEFHEIEGTA